MKWSEKSIRDDVIRYLEGKISANELIERNDDATDSLRSHPEHASASWQRRWELASAVENALAQFAFEYMDESRLRAVLRELVASSKTEKAANSLEQLRLNEGAPAAGGLIDHIASHPFQPLEVFVLDIKRHASNDRISNKNIKPNSSLLTRRNVNPGS